MLRSSNPILSKQDAFTPAAQQYDQNPYNQSRADARYPSQGYPHAPVEPLEARMTFDDVVTKTALTIGVLVISAALAWRFVPEALYFPALIGSGLIGFVVVMFVSFRRKINPGLVLLYAAIEGVFIGMISKVFESLYDGIVVQAVIGTFAAAGCDARGVQVLQHPRDAEVPEGRDHRNHRIRGGPVDQLRARRCSVPTLACGTPEPVRSACWQLASHYLVPRSLC